MNLSTMTPEELFEVNLPMLAKLNAGQALTSAEQKLHEVILAEAYRQQNALREAEMQERLARMGQQRLEASIAAVKPMSYTEAEIKAAQQTYKPRAFSLMR